MFNFFWNWLDPKILRMENWVNAQVVQADKLDIDLDKVKKSEVRSNNMFRKPIPGPNGDTYGPFLANLAGARLLGYVQGPGHVEAFGLFIKGGELWWRHRDAGVTEDFLVAAFSDLEEFFMYVHSDKSTWWDCVLRTEASLADMKKEFHPEMPIPDLKAFIAARGAPDAPIAAG